MIEVGDQVWALLCVRAELVPRATREWTKSVVIDENSYHFHLRGTRRVYQQWVARLGVLTEEQYASMSLAL